MAPLVSLRGSDGGGARVDRAEVLVAAEDVGVAVAVALAGGEHGAAGVADGVVEREVLASGVVGSVNWTS